MATKKRASRPLIPELREVWVRGLEGERTPFGLTKEEAEGMVDRWARGEGAETFPERTVWGVLDAEWKKIEAMEV